MVERDDRRPRVPCSKHSWWCPGRAPTDADAPDPTDAEAGAGEEALFSFLMQNLLPVLLGVWSGWMIGQLSHQALGQYDLPLPLEATPTLVFVPRNVDDFAEAWSLPADELRYALILRETVHGAAAFDLVGARLGQLAKDYVGVYEMIRRSKSSSVASTSRTQRPCSRSAASVTPACCSAR